VGDRSACATGVSRKTLAYIVAMVPTDIALTRLSDRDLLSEIARLAACERQATAGLVALLAEMDVRRLHIAEGCSSLFTYCTERLHLSEHPAYHRIEAARAVRRFPAVLELLVAGSLTLTAVTLLRPHLTEENCLRLLAAARGLSKREVEALVRSLAPLPDVRTSSKPRAGSKSAESGSGLGVAGVAPGVRHELGPGRVEEPAGSPGCRPLHAGRRIIEPAARAGPRLGHHSTVGSSGQAASGLPNQTHPMSSTSGGVPPTSRRRVRIWPR
jgi:hypothetical protein